jgi:hypothetical protein
MPKSFKTEFDKKGWRTAGLSHGVASESSDGSAQRAEPGALGHSERSLAPGEPRIVPLVQLCQIRQAIYRQLLGIALPSRREAFNISANFLP